MPNSPTRAEIESALSGRNKSTRKNTKQNLPEDLHFGEPPRRQQVIGGNLSGVNRRKKFGLFSRYSEVNMVNWLAGVLVLLILAAFFWPQKKNPTAEIAKQFDTNKVIAVEDEILEQAASGNASFARDSDQSRANAFRAEDKIDQKVTELLAQAADFLRAKQYTQPRNANAVNIYQEVLTLRPANVEAKQNLAKIRGHFLYRGVSALDADKPALAQSNLQRLALVDETSSEYQDLQSDIAEYKIDSQVSGLISKATAAFNNGILISPGQSSNAGQNSALSYYQQALQLRSGNEDA